MRRKHMNWVNYGLTGFLIGGTVGTVLSFLLAPTSGKQLRKDINDGFNEYKDKAVDSGKKIYNDAVSYFNDVVRKAEQLKNLSAKYIAGSYTVPVERIEKELASLKRALFAAIEAYNQSPDRTDYYDKRVNDIALSFEDDTLPKYEGMGHRHS